MTRYDIRLRRQGFTSRNIHKHKNYRGILEKHRKNNRWRIYFLVALVLSLASIGYGIMFFLNKL
jgi:zinc transporter ZupT